MLALSWNLCYSHYSAMLHVIDILPAFPVTGRELLCDFFSVLLTSRIL